MTVFFQQPGHVRYPFIEQYLHKLRIPLVKPCVVSVRVALITTQSNKAADCTDKRDAVRTRQFLVARAQISDIIRRQQPRAFLSPVTKPEHLRMRGIVKNMNLRGIRVLRPLENLPEDPSGCE